MNTALKSSPDFEKAYAGLNPEQKAAVDTLEGPMMVIAGPGTGKTQILAIRIGNMLLRSDTDPKNILCLTYTEAGASAMRQRLIQFIGPTAYEITICTFHAFCNSVIRENPDAFQQYSDYDVISDLEKNQLLLGILEKQTRESPLYRYHGRYVNDLYNLFKLFSKIKKENWNADRMLGDIDRHLENLRSDPEFIYKKNGKNYAKGDFKQATFDTEAKRFQRSKSAIRLYQSYQEGLDAMERYEYEDMIRWVIEKFEVDEFLLAKYQEKYQYVLVDEYQDTNGAQNRLLMQLLSYFESANIFAVGDDDQAIYRFQGANVQNMTDFDRQFHPQKIVLVHNYRSSQIILDAADSVIQNNQERLVHKDPQLNKKLLASGNHKDFALRPVFTENHDQKTEILDVCQQVRALLHQGVAANEIAVLFRKNKEAEPFIKWFEANEIPYQTNRQINVLDDLLLQHLLQLLRFLSKEYQDAFSQDGLLFKILHAPFIPLQSEDISRLSWYWSKKKNSLENRDDLPPEYSLLYLLGREDELNAAGITEKSACIELHQKLNAFQKSILDHTPQGLFEKLLTEFKVLDFILASRDKIQYLQVLNSFFEFLKNESQKRPLMTLMEFIDLVEAYRNNSIPLPNTQFVGTKKGVVLSTLHGSKGLEYDYVFMIHATQQNWSQPDRNLFKLPPEYVLEEVNTEEDSRRLFYVGLTRARKGIYLSYPRTGQKKENTVSRFVSEMQNSGLVDYRKHLTEEADLVDQLLIDLSPLKKNYQALDDQLFENFLEHFRLNPTALHKYLECPLAFYYEKVLQIPGARTAALGFGNAVHRALEKFMLNPLLLKQDRFDSVLRDFQKGMEKYRSHFTALEFENYLEEGKSVLPGFLQHFAAEWKEALDSIPEQHIKTEHQGVPISGKLDRIDWIKDGVRVVDYKTGNPEPKEKLEAPGEKKPYGGSYWQQMVFYAILLKNHGPYKNAQVRSSFYFVNPTPEKSYNKKEVLPTPDQMELMEKLIVETYGKIKQGNFTPGCGKTECEWCRYVNSGVTIQLLDLEEAEQED